VQALTSENNDAVRSQREGSNREAKPNMGRVSEQGQRVTRSEMKGMSRRCACTKFIHMWRKASESATRKRWCREEGTRVASSESDSQGVGRGQRFFQNKSKFGANIRPFRMFISAWERSLCGSFAFPEMQYFKSWLHVQRQASRRVEETRRPELAREVEGQVCRGRTEGSWTPRRPGQRASERIVAVVM
jgi:hypothetical protein